jgi:hypothetical protein
MHGPDVLPRGHRGVPLWRFSLLFTAFCLTPRESAYDLVQTWNEGRKGPEYGQFAAVKVGLWRRDKLGDLEVDEQYEIDTAGDEEIDGFR